MTKAIVAALLAASSILPSVASAQDGNGRHDRTERQAERQAARGGDERGGQDRAERQARARDDDRGPQRQADREGRQDRDGGRYDGGRYDRDARAGWDRRGGIDARFSARASQRWSNDWRHDGRYDWNRYRTANRQAFRLPRYYAPRGWGYGYRPFSIGARIAASLFGQNYWIADPWSYRLPAAYGPYRWVRYYDDAVLVDLRTGYVVDVIHSIFW